MARVDGEARRGSVLTLDRALRHLVHDVGVGLAETLEGLTATPARVLGLHDVGRVGPGALADLVVLDPDLGIRTVMRRGDWLS